MFSQKQMTMIVPVQFSQGMNKPIVSLKKCWLSVARQLWRSFFHYSLQWWNSNSGIVFIYVRKTKEVQKLKGTCYYSPQCLANSELNLPVFIQSKHIAMTSLRSILGFQRVILISQQPLAARDFFEVWASISRNHRCTRRGTLFPHRFS